MKTTDRACLDSLTEHVLGAIFDRILKKVYERALQSVTYKGRCVGQYLADILVEGELVIELKCVDRLGNEHSAQCLNYLRASGKILCLLVNFQKPKVEWKRIIDGVLIS